MKQELIDRMEAYVRANAHYPGQIEARAIVAELGKPDYLVIAREICARASDEWSANYRAGRYDNEDDVQYALEQLERAAGLRA